MASRSTSAIPQPASLPQPRPRRLPRRLPLGRTRRRISYERRVRLWLLALSLPAVVLVSIFIYQQSQSVLSALASALAFAALWAFVTASFFEQLMRPLQTLSNVVAALREDDFSFRARGARRGDSLGDLALEINALAGTLQQQRSAARDAITLVERVMTSMQSPVLAFDPAGCLCLLNEAAQDAFHLHPRTALGHAAAELDLAALLHVADQGIYSPAALSISSTHPRRWSVRRTTFRLHGIAHTLLVLSDVASALREEERLAWQRLIRVLSHEINNSLTPIKSLAGSLRDRLPPSPATGENTEDFRRGLTVIEERAASLNRFLQAYQQLTRLPPPQLQPLSLAPLMEQVLHLEARLPVQLVPGPAAVLLGDPDQLQQLLINLLRNAVEAALCPDARYPAARHPAAQDPAALTPAGLPPFNPEVAVTWTCTPAELILHIRDNGPGLTNPANTFVPFYTTKPHGSGIGLVLAQQIATAHKGSVTLFNNTTSSGCTAELRLPLELP